MLTPSGVAALAGSRRLVMRELIAPRTVSVLCLVNSRNKRLTPLARHTMHQLGALLGQVLGHPRKA